MLFMDKILEGGSFPYVVENQGATRRHVRPDSFQFPLLDSMDARTIMNKDADLAYASGEQTWQNSLRGSQMQAPTALVFGRDHRADIPARCSVGNWRQINVMQHPLPVSVQSSEYHGR